MPLAFSFSVFIVRCERKIELNGFLMKKIKILVPNTEERKGYRIEIFVRK
jgi:hypothetical protein